jgi:hypothetical protein
MLVYINSRDKQMPNEQQTNGNAIASLVLSLVGILFCGPCAILGLWFGIKARREIFLSEGREKGGDMATAGIWIGSIALAIMVIAVFVFTMATIIGN